MRMRFTEFVVEQEQYQIGVGVTQPDDPEHLDFYVFAWPDPDNSVSDQWRYLDSKLDLKNNQQYQDFYKMLQGQSEKQMLKGSEVYGPFNHIKDLIK